MEMSPVSKTPIMRYFTWDHLPPELQEISKPFQQLAERHDMMCAGPETSAGLRKLLEAKDCLVRAALAERRP